MVGKVQIVGLLLSVVLVMLILELVRRRQLKEEYSLLWLLVGALTCILALSKSALSLIAKVTGIFYPPSALFLLALLFIIILLLHFSTVISRLTEQNRELAQKIALFENELKKIRDAC